MSWNYTKRIAVVIAVLGGMPVEVFSQDSVLGTFTVGGKTSRFNHVYASFETSPVDDSQKYLVLLVSDIPVTIADRSSERLQVLAQSGGLRAVKLRWKYGLDTIAVVPYHSGIAETGRAFAAMSTINISALDDIRINAEFKSKMLGQTWFFNAIVKAAIAKGGVAVLEPGVENLPPALSSGGKNDPTARGSVRSAPWVSSSRPMRFSTRSRSASPSGHAVSRGRHVR